MANEQDSSLATRHMHIWGRAAQAAGDYMSMKRQYQEQGDQVLKEARAGLIAELAALLEIAKQLDKELPAWKQVFYVQATQNMIAACGITQQEIDDCQRVV
ncbi:MAG TPA: hypothetical protein VKP04_08095 [Ktedonobacteraceae bacterium]|nr:hypothetical protein [Ktedonobacteraceae bacterium]